MTKLLRKLKKGNNCNIKNRFPQTVDEIRISLSKKIISIKYCPKYFLQKTCVPYLITNAPLIISLLSYTCKYYS